MVDAPIQQPTGPEEILWSVRDRLQDILPLAGADNVHIVPDLEDLERSLQNVDGWAWFIEGGDVLPIENEGWDGGDVCNLMSVFRFTVEVWLVTPVDLPDEAIEHLTEPQSNIYMQAGATVYALGSDLLKERADLPLPIGAENPVPQAVYLSRDGNTKVVARIPFDVKFDWDVSAYV